MTYVCHGHPSRAPYLAQSPSMISSASHPYEDKKRRRSPCRRPPCSLVTEARPRERCAACIYAHTPSPNARPVTRPAGTTSMSVPRAESSLPSSLLRRAQRVLLPAASTQAQGFGRRTRRCVCPCPSSAPQDAANTEGSQGATVVSLRTSNGGGPFSTSDPFPDLLYGT